MPLSKEQIKQSIKIELVKRYAKAGDILSWGKLLFPDKFFCSFCDELHEYFIDIAEEEATSTMAPRGHAKTVIKCFLIPIFFGLNHPEKFKYYLNVQATTSKAIKENLGIKNELENNELLVAVYGDLRGEKWTEKLLQLKNGVIFSCIGTGESVRGMHFLNYRPDYIIVDDLYDDDDINNRVSIEKKNNWVLSTLRPAMAIGKKTSFHIQGTAFADYDILHYYKKIQSFKFKKFKAIKNDGKALWKEGRSLEKLDEIKAEIGSVNFSREYQNEPRDEATSIIKTSWVKYAKSIPANEKVIETLCGVDPSIGEKETSDATGIAIVLKTIDENKVYKYYIKALFNERISLHERVEQLKNLHIRHKFTRVFVEAIAGFKDFAAELRRLTNLPIKEITRVRDKVTTLEMKSELFENSKVFILNEISDTLKTELVEQLINNHPRHDDLRDAVLLCLQEKEIDKISIKIW